MSSLITGDADLDRKLAEATPFRFDATCRRCRNAESVTSTTDEKPETSVCGHCGLGVMVWFRNVNWPPNSR